MTKSNVSRSSRAKVGGKATLQPCACCGIAPGPGGRPLSITFEQPDVIDQIHPQLLETWGGDPFLAIKNVGFFLRVILPVKLTDGFAIDFGTWLEIDNGGFPDGLADVELPGVQGPRDRGLHGQRDRAIRQVPARAGQGDRSSSPNRSRI